MELNKEKLKIAEEILEHSSYQDQKKIIIELFRKTNDIILRLIVIDSGYSTNMNLRFFAFEDMEELIKKYCGNIDVDKFIEKLETLKDSKIVLAYLSEAF